MGILLQALCRIRDPHKGQQTLCLRISLLLFHIRMDLKFFRDLPSDGQRRIQCCQRILKHDRAFFSPVAFPFLPGLLQNIFPVKQDLTAFLDLTRRGLDQTHDRLCRHGFSTAGFSDDGHGLTLAYKKGYAAHGLYFPCIAVI